MNAERLHAIVIALNQEMTNTDAVGKLQALINALQSLVNEPANPAHQKTLASGLNAMYVALKDTPSDIFSPTWRQILTEIGGEPLFGSKLKGTVESIFARNQITLAIALEELQQLHKTLKAFKSSLDQGMAAFSHFKIGDEHLKPGECEIGILIPRNAVKNHLLDFADELKDIGFILNSISEVATGKKDDLEIRTISSSDFLVHVNAMAPYAACLAVAIERVVALYRQLLEIRKLHQDLRKQGVPDDKTTGIETYANQLMEKGIEEASTEIVEKFYKGADGGRKNELEVSVKISLNRIANRIDNGFNLEVRAEPIKTKTEEKPEEAEIKKAITTIQSATESMQFLKLEGKPILRLPEGKEKTKKKE